jgi:hypothetical protein
MAPAAMASTISDTNTNVALSVGLSNLSYSESAGDAQTGAVPTVDVSASVQPSRFYLAADFQYSSGNVTYNGATNDWLTGISTPFNGASDQWWIDDTIKIGGVAVERDSFQWTVYGLGIYHYWNRQVPGSAGYLEQYQHEGAGAGFLFQWGGTRWVTSFDVSAYETIGAQMTIPNTIDGFSFAPFRLRSNVGEAASLKVSRLFANRQSLFVVVGVNRFQYGQSGGQFFDPPGCGLMSMSEPSSTTTLTSVRVGWAF